MIFDTMSSEQRLQFELRKVKDISNHRIRSMMKSLSFNIEYLQENEHISYPHGWAEQRIFM